MTIFYPLRARRFAARQTETTQQMIAFLLRQEWFAVPIRYVQKVVPLGNVYGDPKGTGVSLTIYQGQELLVVDVGHRIFAEVQNLELPSEEDILTKNNSNLNQQRFLLIIQGAFGESVGLPIDSPPSIRRVPESAFKPLPEGYVSQGNIQCVSSMIIEVNDEPPLFLLNPNQLTQPQEIFSAL
ncbi:MAG: chemotaxis protein CheW [Moorea sp. SIO2B7]|nr:chemotaxis protein CheW [Moorena sp. SIO2B7]